MLEHAVAIPDDQTIAVATLLEDGERPANTRAGLPLFRQLSPEDALEFAAEIAADMETGYYVTEAGEQWPKKRFVIREILRRMGYSPSFVDKSVRPRWWPEGGTAAFKGYVEWKIRDRATLGRISYDKLVPHIEALTYAGFGEMARRIKLHPDTIPFRDLSQFVMRGAEMLKAQSDPLNGQLTPDGADAYAQIGEAVKGVGDATARTAISGILDAVLVEARARMRKVVEVPAKAAS